MLAVSGVTEELFGAKDLREDERNRMLSRPFKDWMTQRIEANDTVDDLDGRPRFTLRDSDGVLPGGEVIEEFVPRARIDSELVRAVTESGLADSGTADVAVLINGVKDVRHYLPVYSRPASRPCHSRTTTAPNSA